MIPRVCWFHEDGFGLDPAVYHKPLKDVSSKHNMRESQKRCTHAQRDSSAEFSESLRHSKLPRNLAPSSVPETGATRGFGGPKPKVKKSRLFGNPACTKQLPYSCIHKQAERTSFSCSQVHSTYASSPLANAAIIILRCCHCRILVQEQGLATTKFTRHRKQFLAFGQWDVGRTSSAHHHPSTDESAWTWCVSMELSLSPLPLSKALTPVPQSGVKVWSQALRATRSKTRQMKHPSSIHQTQCLYHSHHPTLAIARQMALMVWP